MFLNSSEDYKRLVLLLKDLYARAGVVLKPKATEWPVMLEKSTKKDFDVILIGWTSVVESDLYQIFHSSQIKDDGDNFISYKNPELDKCIVQARSTVDQEKRMPIWQHCERIIYQDQPYTFLYRRKILAFVDKRFKNLKITNFGLNLDSTPFESFVPSHDQKYAK
jgi:peptide/nickel transport system substrate-binding protein